MGSVVNIVPGRLIPADRIIFRVGRRQPHKKPPVSEIVAESPHYVLLIDIDININPAGESLLAISLKLSEMSSKVQAYLLLLVPGKRNQCLCEVCPADRTANSY